MSIIEIILLAISLSMDCFSICMIYGLQESSRKFSCQDSCQISEGLSFAKKISLLCISFILFHIIMLGFGYFLSNSFVKYIEVFDHWIAFGLLAGIGIKMLWESFESDEKRCGEAVSLSSLKAYILISLACSIDAFAVGISLSFSNTSLPYTILFTSIALALFCFLGCYFGLRIKKLSLRTSNIIGGLVLILIGVKTLLDHEYGLEIF